MNGLLILSRAIHFGSCLVLLSIFAVRLLVGDGLAERRLAGLCLLAAAGSGFVWFWAAVAGMSGSGMMESFSPQLFGMVLAQTAPGHVWTFRCAIGVTLAVLLCIVRRAWIWPVGAPLASLLVASLAWLGHAGAAGDGPRPWMLAGDVAHLLSASVWPAGLLPFALLLRRQMKQGALSSAHIAARRFSTMSLITVAVLTASGLVNAFFLIGSFRALLSSGYGRLLLIKIALFGLGVTLGACNLLIHKPRLDSAPQALESMARKVWIEIALATLIVLVVAIMGTLPPASHP